MRKKEEEREEKKGKGKRRADAFGGIWREKAVTQRRRGNMLLWVVYKKEVARKTVSRAEYSNLC